MTGPAGAGKSATVEVLSKDLDIELQEWSNPSTTTNEGELNFLNCIVLYCIVLYCIVLYCIVLYCIVLYCIFIVLYYILLYFIVLYCIVLYLIVLHWIAFLHCTVWHYIGLYSA